MSSSRNSGSSKSGGEAVARRARKEVIDLGNEGRRLAKDDGSEFISASRYVWDQGNDNDDFLEKLEARAAAAADANKKPKKGAGGMGGGGQAFGVAKFGGGKAQLGGGMGGMELDGVGSLEQLELEFVREMEEGVQAFVEPDDEDADGDDDGEGEASAAKLTTNNVWDDLQFEQRKEDVVRDLGETGAAVKKAAAELPKVLVDNDRLGKEKASLKYDIENLEKEELKLIKKYPSLKDKKAGEEKKKSDKGAEKAKDAAYLERMKEVEKKREREAKRRRQMENGVEELEEMEDGGGDCSRCKSTV